MRQRWFITLILLAASAVSLTVALLLPMEEKKDTPPLTPLLEDQLTHIVMQRPEQSDLVLEKRTKGWYITAPVQLPAHEFRIHNLQRILQEENYRAIDMNKLDLAEVDLLNPKTMLTFNHDTHIAFGAVSPLKDGQRYILVNGKLYLHLDTVSYLLDDTPLQFASLSVLGHAPKITELDMPDYHLKWVDERWMLLRQPESKTDISTDSLNTLVNNWQRLHAMQVDTYDAKATSLGQVRVQLANRVEPVVLDVLAAKPMFILAWAEKEIQFELAESQYAGVMGIQ